jgi:hypothetical protein
MTGATSEETVPTRATECRRCRVYCDWVVEPTACVERECVNLYAVEGLDGRRYVGCLMRVFGPEVDAEDLEAARGVRGGFGALRCSREPLPICRASVERAYPQRETPLGCLNPEFAEPPASDSFRVVARVAL